MDWQRLKDRFFFPLLIFLSYEQSRRIGLTPIDDERIKICLKHVRGKVLDIGCGDNRFVKRYGNGVGVDVFPWPGVDLLVKDTSKLPLQNKSFDTISFIACLNHIPNRMEVLTEANRILKDNGLLLVTMLNPVVSYITHKIRYPHDKDQTERGIKEGEVWGFWKKDIKRMLEQSGFKLTKVKPFVYRLNTLYIGQKIRDIKKTNSFSHQ